MKGAVVAKMIPVALPASRTTYTVSLPANAELIIACTDGLEVCAGRLSPSEYRVWTRKRHQPSQRHQRKSP